MPQPFKCPSCGGPLDYDGGSITIRCPFCTNSVIVPEELRTSAAHHHAPTGWHEQVSKLAQIGQLVRAGNKIAAIKLYRETFGVGLKEAKDAVESLAAGRPVEVSRTVEMGGNYPLNPQQIPNWPTPETLAAVKSKGCSLLAVAIVISAIALAVGIGIAVYSLRGVTKTIQDATSSPQPRPPLATQPKSSTSTGTTTPGFASLVLDFGSEGIGAGQFKDSRSIAVDGTGHIYLGEYTGGRVQVFDADGKFLTQWLVDPKMPLRQLAADRKGTVYVVQKGDINRYEGLTGKFLGKLPRAESNGNYDDVVTTLDGRFVAVNRGEDIVSLDADGAVGRIIKASISEQSGDSELGTRVAVDGLGNIYALGTFNEAVFKFAPNGKYVTRFGGKGSEPGLFRAPHSIAVDGQGRIYVADIKGIQVFDANGRYLDVFKLERNLPFGMVFNDRNELFVAARTHVYKFTVN
jgi:LSD1 subclass zinc finger protein